MSAVVPDRNTHLFLLATVKQQQLYQNRLFRPADLVFVHQMLPNLAGPACHLHMGFMKPNWCCFKTDGQIRTTIHWCIFRCIHSGRACIILAGLNTATHENRVNRSGAIITSLVYPLLSDLDASFQFLQVIS